MIRLPVLLPVYRCALRVIALGVPRGRRSEWVAEWTSELWYVGEAAQEQAGFVARHGEIAAFCRGAIEDARCLREHRPAVKASGSAVACCVALSLIALVSIGLAHVLPGVRRAMRLPMYRRAAHLVTIAPSDALPVKTVALGAVRSLQHRPQHLFTELAFYEPISRPIHYAEQMSPVLSVGRASANFLDLLGVRVWFRQSAGQGEPLLMLSETTWRTRFGASSSVFGAIVKLGVQRVRLGGVVPDEAAPAGRRFDAWLLLPSGIADGLADATPVFLIGQLEPRSDPALLNQPRWQMSVPVVDGAVDYDCTTLSSPPLATMQIFLFTVFLALLALPATTSLSLGDYPVRPTSLPWTTAVRRWMFLAAKIAMVLPAIYFGSMDLTYAVAWSSPSAPEYVQLVVSFSATLFALRWALRDQRQRCPVCLGKLSCPARVGQPSRNFLAWNGTELICVGGHGFLHVPELPTSWFGTQRWLHLDPSWSSLFFEAA